MSSSAQDYRAYGNFVQHRSPGIYGAGMLATFVLLAGLVLTMIVGLALGFFPAGLVVAAATVVAFVGMGTPVGPLVARRLVFFNTRRAGEHQWRSGVTSRNASAKTRLPGMLGRTQLLERVDPFGSPFVVIYNPARGGYYTIVARCIAEGPAMQDQDRVDTWVGRYSAVLGSCGTEQALVCAKAITDTAPDPGDRLAAMVDASRSAGARSDSAPALARAVIDEVVADYPSASSENITYFELTFRGRGLDRKGSQTAILTELARRVPGLMGQLAEGGGGSVSMVTAAELPTIVRCAYDPAAKPFLEQAALAPNSSLGSSSAAATVEWDEAGPVAGQEWWSHYTHDSGHSVTWEMSAAPRSAISERALIRLLAPHSDFTRKRVALIYRAHSPAEAVSVSESDANTASFVANQSKSKVKATASLQMRSTEQTRQEVASGAGLLRFYLMVTATVRDLDALDQAVANVEQQGQSGSLSLRRSYGSQAAGFAATLPVGLVPWEHTMIPDKVRELL